MGIRYKIYSEYLKEKYGEKVYKIPINIPVTCPNRDGNVATGGCTFCSDIGAGFECHSNDVKIKDQLALNIEKIGKKYKAKKFIAYFQNFSNTYLPLDQFRTYVEEACIEDVVEICVSSRPDCVSNAYLDILAEVRDQYGVNISFELGLQTVNYHTLEKINRGHGLAEFIDASMRIKAYNFDLCVHLILNLPWDNDIDLVENAKVLSALNIDQIKIHSLYILKNTVMGNQYLNKEFEVISAEEYVDKVVKFIRYCDPNIVFQRLVGRAPKDETLFCNWDMSWWRIKDLIDEKFEKENYYQGDLFDYLNGRAVKVFEG